ncbi:YVTN family beta-propeller protein [Pseudomonas sp. GGS8]|uniref:YncE family protein n=1 Tax=Pseudomonas sp. GGS8 TaxID=2817892 RepID=UPI0020A2063B|nr:YncE family protein [Pseudomonas sp. GGS8]MCP1444128.1 YVTN family beta-propeller protein [Pseudomonas sp. GGS8]
MSRHIPQPALPLTINDKVVHLIPGLDNLIISKDSARLYFRQRIDSDYFLRAMDANTLEIIHTYSAGRWPAIKGLSPDGIHAFAMDMATDSLYVINTVNHAVSAATKVPSYPTDMTVSPNGSYAYLCGGQNDGYMKELNAPKQTVIRSMKISAPGNLATNASGSRVYASCWNEGQRNSIEVIDITRWSVIASIPVNGFTSVITPSTDGRHLYALNMSANELLMIDAQTNKIIKTVDHETATRSICCTPDGKHLYTVRSNSTHVHILDAQSLEEVHSINVDKNHLMEIRIRPDNGEIYVLHALTDA